MPLTSQAVDALGLVTISLVALLVICDLTCIIYILYFHARIQRSEFHRLSYFNGPWIVRIFLILFAICWGLNEVIRLTFFRKEGKVFHSVSLRWQEDICKIYILVNLGFSEPCLFLIMSFLLQASLKWRGSGILTWTWNFKTIGYVMLYCLPIFILDLLVVIVAPELRHGKIRVLRKLPRRIHQGIHAIEYTRPTCHCLYFPLVVYNASWTVCHRSNHLSVNSWEANGCVCHQQRVTEEGLHTYIRCSMFLPPEGSFTWFFSLGQA